MLGILTTIGGFIASSFKNWASLRQAQAETKLAIEQGKQQIILEQIATEQKIALMQLQATPKWFKIVTFLGWFAPYVLIMVAPEKGLELFANLGKAPLWYVQTSQVLLFAVWGISVSRDTIAAIFNNMASSWRMRNAVNTAEVIKFIENRIGNKLGSKEVKNLEDAIEASTKESKS